MEEEHGILTRFPIVPTEGLNLRIAHPVETRVTSAGVSRTQELETQTRDETHENVRTMRASVDTKRASVMHERGTIMESINSLPGEEMTGTDLIVNRNIWIAIDERAETVLKRNGAGAAIPDKGIWKRKNLQLFRRP